VHVEGDFSSEGNILVKGIVSGNVKTSKLLTVENGAKIFANVKSGNALVSGEIKGNVRAEDRVELTKTARVLGDIDCMTLVVEAGALVMGRIVMKGMEAEETKPERRISAGRVKSRVVEKVEETESDEESLI
jgi:cytoskeletal protein CcmA (bactofilin family)